MAMTAEQNANIADYWNKNKGDPQAIMRGMTQFGVGVDDVAAAIGRNRAEVGNYLVDAGAARGFGGYSKGITDTDYGSAAQPSQYSMAQAATAANPSVVVGGTPAGTTAGQMLRNPNQPAAPGVQTPVADTFRSGSRPMAGQITGMLNQGRQFGLAGGLAPIAPTGGRTFSPLAQPAPTMGGSLQPQLARVTGGSTAGQPGAPVAPGAATPSAPPVLPGGNMTATGRITGLNDYLNPQLDALIKSGAVPAPAGYNQQRFKSMVAQLQPGTPMAFGNGNIVKQADGSIVVNSPSFRGGSIKVDTSAPVEQQLQQLQSIYDMASAPPSGQ